VEPPGSTQDHLNYQFDMAITPVAGTLTGQATLRTEVEPVPLALPLGIPAPPAASDPAAPTSVRPHSTQRIAPEDLDSTWASRPMRVRPVAEPEKALVAPAAPSRIRAAAVAPANRKPLWIVAAGALLLLVALGLWLTPRPTRVVSVEPSPAPAVLPETSLAPAAPTPAPVVLPAATLPAASAPRIVEEKPGPRPRPVPSEPRAAPAPLEPMKAGDLIRRGQPNVEEPEVKILAAYSYPAAAKGSGKKVTIRLAVLVDETGQVTDAQIREGDKSGLGFEEAALAAAKRTRFFPPTRDGIAGRMWTELLLDFSE
jgi:TonB family protein